MSDYLSKGGTFINSIIGEGSVYKGDIKPSGLLRIDGDFKGMIADGEKVLIGKGGRVEADITAQTVVVGGVLKGSIIATEKIVVLSTGLILGNLSAPRLLMEDGVLVQGHCAITGREKEQVEQKERTSWINFFRLRKKV